MKYFFYIFVFSFIFASNIPYIYAQETNSSVNIVWYANDSYVPNFYKGKALRSEYTSTTLTAIPQINYQGTLIQNSELNFTWKVNGKTLQNSGLGKNQITIKNSLTSNSPEVSIVVTSTRTGLSAQSSLQLPEYESRVLLYENDPLLGILYNKALLSTFSVQNKEVTLKAIPYYFTKDALGYTWKINGNTFSSTALEDGITLRKDDASSGSSQLSIFVKSLKNILQKETSNLTITF